MTTLFEKAKPIWIKGKEKEMHIRASFRTPVMLNGKKTCVKIATSGIYNLFVNGVFAAYGPARAGRGHFRLDCIDITSLVKSGENIIAIEVAGYNANSFYVMNQPSFLQAEIVEEDKVVSFTGDEQFQGRINPYVIRKVRRYSFQRPMLEAYRLEEGYDLFYIDSSSSFKLDELAVQEDKTIIERYAPYPQYEVIEAKPISSGSVGTGCRPEKPRSDRGLLNIGPKLLGFKPEELEVNVSEEVQCMAFTVDEVPDLGNLIHNNQFRIYEFPYNATGMADFDIECDSDLSVYCVFDEVLQQNDIALLRITAANVIKFDLKKGSYHLKFFEVYTCKYFKVIVIGGNCKIDNLKMIEYKHPPVDFSLPIVDKDPELKLIYEAALETYRQNAVDIYMDCPSRERAGWLCDSFFTSRVEHLLTGKSLIEKSFLENFLHEDNYEYLPEGMLPMCYPADHYDGGFISNWAMWMVVELEEYLDRSGDRDLVDRFRDKVYRLLEYLARYENSDGLLEKLDGWVFVEWSKANELVQDVNYPTNMLYSAALACAGRLYNDEALLEKSEKVKKVVLAQSFNGKFFTDNAVRKDGVLVNSGETTEVCQYYAFFFNIATPESHRELFDTLIRDFGPDRKNNNPYPDVHFANAFIGNYLRLDIMMRYGYKKEVLENIRGYFLYMAERTGTLWENVGDYASCNHGFASHVIYWLAQM